MFRQLMDKIATSILAVALFALGEALAKSAMTGPADEVRKVARRVSMTAEDWKRPWKAWLRGTFIGLPIVSMPTRGAYVASFLSEAVKHPQEFGNSAIKGVTLCGYPAFLAMLGTIGVNPSAFFLVLHMLMRI